MKQSMQSMQCPRCGRSLQRETRYIGGRGDVPMLMCPTGAEGCAYGRRAEVNVYVPRLGDRLPARAA